jgi:hypothetical protein
VCSAVRKAGIRSIKIKLFTKTAIKPGFKLLSNCKNFLSNCKKMRASGGNFIAIDKKLPHWLKAYQRLTSFFFY